MISEETWAKRFWAKVDVSQGLGPKGECWEWRGASGSGGYGHFYYLGACQLAHRVAWHMHYGEWPAHGACHTCDNTKCVRLDHLFDGDQKANAHDAFVKGRCANSAWGRNLAKTHLSTWSSVQ